MISYTMLTPMDEMYATGALVTDGESIQGVGDGLPFLDDKERLQSAEAALADGVEKGLGLAFGNASTLIADGPHESSFTDLDTACETIGAFLKRLNDEVYGDADKDEDAT